MESNLKKPPPEKTSIHNFLQYLIGKTHAAPRQPLVVMAADVMRKSLSSTILGPYTRGVRLS